jgi:hypothetical protein
MHSTKQEPAFLALTDMASRDEMLNSQFVEQTIASKEYPKEVWGATVRKVVEQREAFENKVLAANTTLARVGAAAVEVASVGEGNRRATANTGNNGGSRSTVSTADRAGSNDINSHSTGKDGNIGGSSSSTTTLDLVGSSLSEMHTVHIPVGSPHSGAHGRSPKEERRATARKMKRLRGTDATIARQIQQHQQEVLELLEGGGSAAEMSTLQTPARRQADGGGGGSPLISAPRPVSPQARRKATARTDERILTRARQAAAASSATNSGAAPQNVTAVEAGGTSSGTLRARPTTRSNPHMVRDLVSSMTKQMPPTAALAMPKWPATEPATEGMAPIGERCNTANATAGTKISISSFAAEQRPPVGGTATATTADDEPDAAHLAPQTMRRRKETEMVSSPTGAAVGSSPVPASPSLLRRLTGKLNLGGRSPTARRKKPSPTCAAAEAETAEKTSGKTNGKKGGRWPTARRSPTTQGATDSSSTTSAALERLERRRLGEGKGTPTDTDTDSDHEYCLTGDAPSPEAEKVPTSSRSSPAADVAVAVTPARTVERRMDQGLGPFTRAEFASFYGDEDVDAAWNAALSTASARSTAAAATANDGGNGEDTSTDKTPVKPEGDVRPEETPARNTGPIMFVAGGSAFTARRGISYDGNNVFN